MSHLSDVRLVATADPHETRRCRKCLRNKVLKEFEQYCGPDDQYRYRWRCQECANTYAQEWRETHPKVSVLRNLKRRYGLTDETFKALGVLCHICGEDGEHVDHNHLTGKVRGLLCNHCNRGLGGFRDDTFLLAEAIVYLRKHD